MNLSVIVIIARILRGKRMTTELIRKCDAIAAMGECDVGKRAIDESAGRATRLCLLRHSNVSDVDGQCSD